MAQTRTHDFSSPRSASLLNRGRKDVNPPGVYVGFDVVVQGAGTFGGGGGAIEIEHTTDSRGILVSREGVRIEENATPVGSPLDIATPDATLDRIDLVVAQHTFGTSNPPATYAVITGTPLATPVEPTIPSDANVLAAVYVENAAGSLTSDQIEPRGKVFANTISDFLDGDSRTGKLENALQTAIIAGTTQLKAIDPADRSRHQITLVENADGAGSTGLYWFDSTSTATDDGLTIIQPTNFFFGTTGRWILLTLAGVGTFIAYVGSTVDAQFADMSLALTALEASEARRGIFYILSTTTLPTNVTTTKPVKIIGLELLSFIAMSAIWTVDVPTVLATPEAPTLEFINVQLSRSVPGGEIVFAGSIRFFMEGSILRDTSSSAGNSFIRTTFATATEHKFTFERTELRPGATNSLFESDGTGASTSFMLRNCLVISSDLDQFIARSNVSAGTLQFYVFQNTYFESDGFDGATDLGGPVHVVYDDTSLFIGTTEIPARIDNVSGIAVWNDEMERQSSQDVGDAMKFYLGPELKIAEGSYAFSGASTLSFVSLSPRIIRGASRDATTLTTTMPASAGVNLISTSGTCMEFNDLSFEITFNASNSTGDAIIQTGGTVPLNFRRVRVKVLGGVIERAITLVLGYIEDVILEGDATGRWKRPLQVAPSVGTIARCEKVKISEFTEVGLALSGSGSGSQIDVNVADASASFLGISVAATGRLSHSIVHGAGAAAPITGGIGISATGSSAAVDTPGAIVDSNMVEGTDSASTKVIDTGIEVILGRSMVSNNIITECGADGILIDTSADESLVNGNSITDCVGAAIDDVATATTNAKTGNYSRGNGSGIDTPNKAGNIEL